MKGKEQESILPYWFMSADLDTLFYANELAKKESSDLMEICRNEKADILIHLKANGLFVRSGEPQLIFSEHREKVMVQSITVERTLAIGALEEERSAKMKIKEDLDLHSAKLNAIFDSTALFIWTMDGEMRIHSFNKRFREQMGAWFFRDVDKGDYLFTEPVERNHGRP